MSTYRHTFRTRIATAALLTGLSLAAACGDSPTAGSGGNGNPRPQQPQQPQPDGVAQVLIAPDTLTLLATGGHRRVDAIARTGAGQVLQDRIVGWASSDVTVATVDASGNVTGHQPGRAWITATVDGRTAQARVDVLPLTVDSIALGQAWMQVEWGTVRQMGATLFAADGRVLYDRAVTWATSDSSVATVDAVGRITGIAGGRAWITATSEGRTARAEVVVPITKTLTLATAGGRVLPTAVLDTVYDEGQGRRRRVRVVVMAGTLSLHSHDGTYEQRVVLRTHERLGTCTEWGSCIWYVDEIVTDRVVSDRGDLEHNVFTGEPIFVSSDVKGWTYYAQQAPGDGFTVWQVLPGTDALLPWGFRL
jgi:hypothetical protein